LAGDLAKLCVASGVSAVIDAGSVPLSAAAHELMAQGKASFETAVSGGDDYEILCAIPEDRFEAFTHAATDAGLPVASIGVIVAGTTPPRWMDKKGEEIVLARLSYSHF
jgi:thiamine-monophosphate kinase